MQKPLKNGWRKVKLKEVCREITVGHVGSMAKEYVDEGIPFLRSQNILPFSLELSSVKYITPEFHAKLKKSALLPGDVAVVRTGYPGIACVIPSKLSICNCADLVIIRPSEEVNAKYLTCIFNSTWGQGTIAGTLVGVAQQHFNVSAAKEMEVNLPPRHTQDKIAGILSAYDDLIENNTRRIEILEEMARSIYREWFVKFRFPGHEQVQMVNSELGLIPQGWFCKFSDYIDFKEGPGLRRWQYREEGIPFLNIRTLVNNNIDLSKVQFLDPLEVQSKYLHFLLKPYDHVVSSSGTLGRIVTIQSHHLPLMLNTSIIRMRPKNSKIGKWQLKHFLHSDYFQNQIRSYASGVAQMNYGPSHLQQMWIVAPINDIGQRYEELVTPIEELIFGLVQKNDNLRQTRDLLLPRLISGEIDVENLDINTGEIAA